MVWRVEVLTDFKDWMRYAQLAPRKTIFHLLGDLYSAYPFLFFLLKNDDRPVLGVPLRSTKKLMLPFLDSNLETLPYLGFAVFDEDQFNNRQVGHSYDAIRVLTGFISSTRRIVAVRVKNPPYFKDVRPFLWNGWDAKISYTYTIEPSKVGDILSSKVRKTVRRVLKNEPEIHHHVDWNFFAESYSAFSKDRKFYTEEGLSVVKALGRMENQAPLRSTVVTDGAEYSIEVILVDPSNKVGYRMFSISSDGSPKLNYDYLALYEAVKDLEDSCVEKLYLMGASSYHMSTFVSKFASRIETYFWLTYVKPRIPGFVLRKMGIQVCPWL